MEEELEVQANELRGNCLAIEKRIRNLTKHGDFHNQVFTADQYNECKTQLMLAVRHMEDARMRLGKLIQYSKDGVSIYDK